MFYLVRNTLTNEYKTIYQQDKQEFLNLSKFFKTDFKWEVIEDINSIQEILKEHFTSKGRGEDYNENLPSVTKIAYGLFPINIQEDKFLLRWQNDTPLDEQVGGTQDTLSKGTFCHYILEQFVLDSERKFDKPLIECIKLVQQTKKPSKKIISSINNKLRSYISNYVEMAYVDKEILRKIPNLDELKPLLEDLALNKLIDFVREELIFTDLVYSEIFLENSNIQGSVDYVGYKDGKFSIIDYKTTSSVDKKTGRPKFKSNTDTCLAPYARQLYIYNELLKDSKFSHCVEDEIPDFYIIQLHLISGKYKKFKISSELVEGQGHVIDKVLEWYNNSIQGIETKVPVYEDLEAINL